MVAPTREQLQMLTRAVALSPEIESHKITARVRVTLDDRQQVVIFTAVRGEYLVADSAITYEQFKDITSDCAMKGVYAIVLEELTKQMDEAWDDGSIPFWTRG